MYEVISTSQSFNIHDNYETPFVVTIDQNNVTVIKTDTNETVLDINGVIRVFIGESPVTDITIISEGHGPAFKGNTILVQTGNHEYTYIGARIYSFRSLAEINKYVSEVGNNDVPYPYAVDINDNFYLMTEDVILNQLDEFYHLDPYSYLYGITGEQAKNVLGIDYLVGSNPEEHFNIGYTPYPRRNYNYSWMTNLHAGVDISNQYFVSEDAYVEMMEILEESFNLCPLEILEIIVDRVY